ALKCASQSAFGPCNHSDNPTFRDIASPALTRRAAIGGATGALAIALAGTLGACSGGPSASATAATDEGSSSGDEDRAASGHALALSLRHARGRQGLAFRIEAGVDRQWERQRRGRSRFPQLRSVLRYDRPRRCRLLRPPRDAVEHLGACQPQCRPYVSL